MPNLIAFDMMGTQPMTGQSSLIFSMKSHYSSAPVKRWPSKLATNFWILVHRVTGFSFHRWMTQQSRSAKRFERKTDCVGLVLKYKITLEDLIVQQSKDDNCERFKQDLKDFTQKIQPGDVIWWFDNIGCLAGSAGYVAFRNYKEIAILGVWRS